jgi:MFS family permease
VLAFLNFAGALPLIQADWHLSNAQAGAIQAAGQVGYVLAVLVLSSMTDYVGAERLIAGSALWAGLSNLALATLAQGAVGAMIFRALTGFGVAGIYMPGVRLISQRYTPARRGRALGLFVASFTLGTAASIALGGSLAAALGWRTAFALTSLGPLAGALIAWRALPKNSRPAQPKPHGEEPRPLSDLIHNRPALLAIAAYTAHAWELLGLRGWLPAFLTAVLIRTGADLADATRSGATMAGIATLLSALSTAWAAALSDRFGRTRMMVIISAASFVAILGLGFTSARPWALVAIAGLVTASLANADSAVISTTFTESVPVDYLGRALAIYSFLGFTAGGIAPLAFGAVLDFTGPAAPSAATTVLSQWRWAFATFAFGSLVGLASSVTLHRQLRRADHMTVRSS